MSTTASIIPPTANREPSQPPRIPGPGTQPDTQRVHCARGVAVQRQQPVDLLRWAAEVTPATASGACLCGSVTFTVVLPSNWVAHCHCTRCQRAHGAAFVTWVSVANDRASIADPNGDLRWHGNATTGQRGFCSVCGSSMFFKGGRWPDELHVARAQFVDPIDRVPQVHGYYDTRVEWFSVSDDLPKKPDPAANAT